MNPDLNLERSTTEEDALIMEAVKIHGTKWTEIAKMWVASGRSARTAALCPKYPHQRTGLLVARPGTTPSGCDPHAAVLQRPAAPLR